MFKFTAAPFLIACFLLPLGACGGDETSAPAPPGPSPLPMPPPPPPLPPPPPTPESAEDPYRSPFFASSLWPVFHGNSYATASVATIGPGDVESAEIVSVLNVLVGESFVSPWTVMGERYPDGSQPVLATPTNGVAKYAIRNNRLEAIDFLELDRDIFDFDWALLARRGGDVVVTERKFNRIAIVGDVLEGSVFSPLEVKRRISVNPGRYGPLLSHHALAPDGTLMALTEANKLIAVDLDAGAVIAEFTFPAASGASFQNSFPIDETGRIFVAAQSEASLSTGTGPLSRLHGRRLTTCVALAAKVSLPYEPGGRKS